MYGVSRSVRIAPVSDGADACRTRCRSAYHPEGGSWHSVPSLRPERRAAKVFSLTRGGSGGRPRPVDGPCPSHAFPPAVVAQGCALSQSIESSCIGPLSTICQGDQRSRQFRDAHLDGRSEQVKIEPTRTSQDRDDGTDEPERCGELSPPHRATPGSSRGTPATVSRSHRR